jgi:hypothetical protein
LITDVTTKSLEGNLESTLSYPQLYLIMSIRK